MLYLCTMRKHAMNRQLTTMTQLTKKDRKDSRVRAHTRTRDFFI